MEFEWDEIKNLANFSKHGIWFEEAQTVWASASASEFFDPDHSEEEDRFIRVGFSTKGNLLLVVFCERLKGLKIRIISARRASNKETKDYEKRI